MKFLPNSKETIYFLQTTMGLLRLGRSPPEPSPAKVLACYLSLGDEDTQGFFLAREFHPHPSLSGADSKSVQSSQCLCAKHSFPG